MKKLLLLASAAFLCASVLAQDPCDKLGWQLAVHAYTFKNFSIFDCIDKTAALGLRSMSLSGSVNLDGKKPVKTVEISDADLQRILDKTKAAGIKLVNVGVVQLPNNENECRKSFDFAKKAGIDTLVAEPPEDALDLVEKLCKEYNIKVAIHEHARPNHYWNPETVLAAIKGRTPLMGACADTGHWLRSGLDPVECLKKLDGRVIVLHFKDLVPDENAADDNAPGKTKKESRAMHDVPWGTGAGNVKGQMEEMKRQHFHGAFCIEYEYHWDNSMPEVAECVKFFKATAAELAK
jgi:sugar phosphate isomerase/epimerase